MMTLKALLGEVFMDTPHRYRTNVDILTIVAAWGLEIGKTNKVECMLKACTREEWMYGLQPVLARAIPLLGFDLEDGEVTKEGICFLFPFIRWKIGED
ncbi:hypothetical protein SUGI_0170360 [Cryptomeria japonica]|nr:hypothetical protein SUGI_0170360 [Cryptomeria japonica]